VQYRRKTCGSHGCITAAHQEGGKRDRPSPRLTAEARLEIDEQLKATTGALMASTASRHTDAELHYLGGAVLSLVRLVEMLIPVITQDPPAKDNKDPND